MLFPSDFRVADTALGVINQRPQALAFLVLAGWLKLLPNSEESCFHLHGCLVYIGGFSRCFNLIDPLENNAGVETIPDIQQVLSGKLEIKERITSGAFCHWCSPGNIWQCVDFMRARARAF